jgi:hypothetical protein
VPPLGAFFGQSERDGARLRGPLAARRSHLDSSASSSKRRGQSTHEPKRSEAELKMPRVEGSARARPRERPSTARSAFNCTRGGAPRNEANLLEELHVSVRGAESSVLSNLDYNARGQRVLCEHTRPGGAASHSTTYEYDPKTFRLTRLITTRPSDSATLQDLRYFFDAVGNITEVQDFADTTPFFSGTTPVSGTGKYRYDALYRLTDAEGREHPGQQPSDAEPVRGAVPHPNDLQALERYSEAFSYDQVGNILAVGHTSPSTNWNRRYQYATTSNRLLATTVGLGDPRPKCRSVGDNCLP